MSQVKHGFPDGWSATIRAEGSVFELDLFLAGETFALCTIKAKDRQQAERFARTMAAALQGDIQKIGGAM